MATPRKTTTKTTTPKATASPAPLNAAQQSQENYATALATLELQGKRTR